MDLYKWTYKLYPWTSGELLRDVFFLALETREIDMRASPYDLQSLGYEPICIETDEGRQRYVMAQQDIYRKGKLLRERLAVELEQLLNLVK